MNEQGAQKSEDISILFAAGGNDPLQAGVNFRPLFGVEAAAHLLLEKIRQKARTGSKYVPTSLFSAIKC
jgi:hypothetical protein